MSPRHFIFSGVFAWAAMCAAAAETLSLPRLPMIPPEGRKTLSQPEIRGQLRSFLPRGAQVITESRAQQGRVGDDSAEAGEPQTVAARIGIHPVLDLADANYRLIPASYVPALVDWFEALAESMGCTPAETRAAGFRCNKVARLMRVFISTHLRSGGQMPSGTVPAIGWCRALLQEDWGRCRKGETHTFVLVGTDQGWFIVDPYERLQRRLDTKNHNWVIEFVVL